MARGWPCATVPLRCEPLLRGPDSAGARWAVNAPLFLKIPGGRGKIARSRPKDW